MLELTVRERMIYCACLAFSESGRLMDSVAGVLKASAPQISKLLSARKVWMAGSRSRLIVVRCRCNFISAA